MISRKILVATTTHVLILGSVGTGLQHSPGYLQDIPREMVKTNKLLSTKSKVSAPSVYCVQDLVHWLFISPLIVWSYGVLPVRRGINRKCLNTHDLGKLLLLNEVYITNSIN